LSAKKIPFKGVFGDSFVMHNSVRSEEKEGKKKYEEKR